MRASLIVFRTGAADVRIRLGVHSGEAREGGLRLLGVASDDAV